MKTRLRRRTTSHFALSWLLIAIACDHDRQDTAETDSTLAIGQQPSDQSVVLTPPRDDVQPVVCGHDGESCTRQACCPGENLDCVPDDDSRQSSTCQDRTKCVGEGGTCTDLGLGYTCCSGLICSLKLGSNFGVCEKDTPPVQTPTIAASTPLPQCGGNEELCFGRGDRANVGICCFRGIECRADPSGAPVCHNPCNAIAPLLCQSSKGHMCCFAGMSCGYDYVGDKVICIGPKPGCPAETPTYCGSDAAGAPICCGADKTCSGTRGDGSAICCERGTYFEELVGQCLPIGSKMCENNAYACLPYHSCCQGNCCPPHLVCDGLGGCRTEPLTL